MYSIAQFSFSIFSFTVFFSPPPLFFGGGGGGGGVEEGGGGGHGNRIVVCWYCFCLFNGLFSSYYFRPDITVLADWA